MKSITVAELIAQLQNQDQDALVIIGYNYGDRGRTIAASPIRRVEETLIRESAYSDSGYAIGEPEDEDVSDEEYNQAAYVVIR